MRPLFYDVLDHICLARGKSYMSGWGSPAEIWVISFKSTRVLRIGLIEMTR